MDWSGRHLTPAGRRAKRETPQAERRGVGFFTVVKITFLFAPRGKQVPVAERNGYSSIEKIRKASLSLRIRMLFCLVVPVLAVCAARCFVFRFMFGILFSAAVFFCFFCHESALLKCKRCLSLNRMSTIGIFHKGNITQSFLFVFAEWRLFLHQL